MTAKSRFMCEVHVQEFRPFEEKSLGLVRGECDICGRVLTSTSDYAYALPDIFENNSLEEGEPTKPLKTHSDGSICLEGTRRVPENFKSCCNEFESHTDACTFDIRYEWWGNPQGWFIPIVPSAGGGGIAIGYCPHCGKKLDGGEAASVGGRFLDCTETD